MAYTDKMVSQIEAAQPLNLETAKKLASELNVSYRSIISKAKQMGFVYVAKAPAAKKDTLNKVTKADLVADIAKATNINFVALDKANTADLENLLTFLTKDDTSL